MKKFLFNHGESILIVGCTLVILYLVMGSKNQPAQGNEVKIEAIQHHIDSLFKSIDSASVVEKTIVKERIVNNIYHETQSNIIIHSPDSINAKELHTELAGYMYLLKFSGSKGNEVNN